MDIATVVGIVLAQILIFGSIMMGAGIAAFIDVPSIVIVFGGTIAATMISFPMAKFTSLGRVFKKTFMFSLSSLPGQIESMAEFAALARREGLLALEEKLDAVDDAFLVKGLRLVVDGFPPEVVRDILSTDLYAMQERHTAGKAVMDKMGEVAPAMGMLGTLIGLVTMLKNLSDPSQIGYGYGGRAPHDVLRRRILSNVIFLPIADQARAAQEGRDAAPRGHDRGHRRHPERRQAGQMVKEKLKAFLSPGGAHWLWTKSPGRRL